MDKNCISLSAALEGYFIAAHARRLSPATLRDYDNTFRKLEEFLGRDPPLNSITPADIRGFLSSMDGLSAKTLLNYHTGLSALWTWAVKEGIAEEHILHKVRRPRPEQHEIVPYTRRDLQAMLAACDNTRAYVRPGKRRCSHTRPTADRDRAMVAFLVDTGVRASELCNMRLRDVRLDTQQALVMGKGSKERLVEFSPNTAKHLWRYLATRDETVDRDFFFVSLDGQPLSRYALRRLIINIGTRAGVPRANVHRFRHTFAIQFLRNQGNIFALQRMLGHSTLEMVNRYLKIAQADLKRAHRTASPLANWGL
ncbi:MAG: tyrosine-type recombinase/integrase [Anaerolineae bacterium]